MAEVCRKLVVTEGMFRRWRKRSELVVERIGILRLGMVSIVVSIGTGKSPTFVPQFPGNHAVCQQLGGMVPYLSPCDGCLTSACSRRALGLDRWVAGEGS